MKTLRNSLIIAGAVLLVGSVAYGQRGRGEDEGLARQGVRPEMTQIEGRLTEVKTGPCPRTTGRAYIGTHLFIERADGAIANVHMGSADAVKPFVDKLAKGDSLRVTAFRTERLEEGHYVAKTITAGDETLEVRRDDLSPFWSGQRGDRRDRPDRRDRRERRRDDDGNGPRGRIR